MTQPPIPAGWYPNPDGSPSLRWWDGRQWTEAVSVGPPSPPPASAAPGQAASAGQPAAPEGYGTPPPGPYGTPPPGHPMAPPRPRPAPIAGRTGLVLAVVFLSVAVVVGVPSLVFVIRTAVDQYVNAPMIDVPGTSTLSLQEGTYYLYDPNGSSALTSDNLQVQARSGSQPTPAAPSGTETFARGGTSYTATVGFHAGHAGVYDITVSNTGSRRVIVALSFTSVAASIAGWAVGIVAAVLFGIAGVVLLIVALVSRSRVRRDAARVGYY
ncbi:MAG TPA: DUF2510 domain-containing protein [Acidimicrobiales bacterium]|nr:DUF2510 domain-containing protein [Acidimicrobiales bacterium]